MSCVVDLPRSEEMPINPIAPVLLMSPAVTGPTLVTRWVRLRLVQQRNSHIKRLVAF
jgi:hypothetical protein